MKKVSKLVQEILQRDEKARNSDAYLIIKVYAVLFEAYGISESLDAVIRFMNLIATYKLPPIWSITRARRKVQAQFPELRATDDVGAMRELTEDSMRRWSVNPYQE